MDEGGVERGEAPCCAALIQVVGVAQVSHFEGGVLGGPAGRKGGVGGHCDRRTEQNIQRLDVEVADLYGMHVLEAQGDVLCHLHGGSLVCV